MNGMGHPFNYAGVSAAFPAPLGVTLATADPIGFNELSAIYQSYRVYGSKVSWTLAPSALSDTVQVAILPAYANSTATYIALNVAEVEQQPFAKSAQITSSRGRTTLSSFISQHKLLGVRKQAIEDDLSTRFTGNGGGGNPSALAYWFFYWAAPDAVNLSTALNYNVKVTYFVEWYEQPTGLFENS